MVPALLPRGSAAGAARSIPAAGAQSWGVTKGALLLTWPQLAMASLAGVWAGRDALVLFVLLPVPPGDVCPEIGAKPGRQWVRQGDAIVRCCPSGLLFPTEGLRDPDGQRGGAQALTAKLSCSKMPQWGWI